MEQLYASQSRPVCKATLCVALIASKSRADASTSSPTKSTSSSERSISTIETRRHDLASGYWPRKSACRIGR